MSFAPLRERNFRLLWTSGCVMYFAVWMQTVGVSWLMVSLTPSPLLVALVPAASSLAACLFALAGGIMADRFALRRYVLTVQCCMLVSATLLWMVSLSPQVHPAALLGLTFLFGCLSALLAPAWHSAHCRAAAPEHLSDAISLATIPYNLARAAAPAIAGVVIAGYGSSAVFGGAVAGFAAVIAMIHFLDPLGHIAAASPAARASGPGDIVGLARASRPCRLHLLRVGLFVASGAGLIALLPALVRERLGGDAPAYGFLVAASGVGAATGAALLGALARRYGREAVVGCAILVCAATTLVIARTHSREVLLVLVWMTGAAWVMVVNAGIGAMQVDIPDAARARALGLFLVVFQGSGAFGSVLWGSVAERFGTTAALTASGVAFGGILLARARLRP